MIVCVCVCVCVLTHYFANITVIILCLDMNLRKEEIILERECHSDKLIIALMCQ